MDSLPHTTAIDTRLLLSITGIASVALLVGMVMALPKALRWLINRLLPTATQDAYSRILAPHQQWLGIILLLAASDLLLLYSPDPLRPQLPKGVEVSLGILLGLAIVWFASRLFRQLFDVYLVETAVQSKRKLNGELLIFAKVVSNLAVLLVVIGAFSVAHGINIFGLLASLGVGGIAIAFGAQKTLEQILGGIVLYIDRPFVTDDYIAYDGTFGRVESIGLRSTRLRVSGKGTVLVVPNSSLVDADVENYTAARKVISIVYLNFQQPIEDDEKALIRRVILDSTQDLVGIDTRSSEVEFRDIPQDQGGRRTQAQVNLFVLGSGSYSMDLRRQLIDSAKQNIVMQLKDYGAAFDLDEKTINIDSPITL